VGRRTGFRERREVRRSVPEAVRKGNLARITEPMLKWWEGGGIVS